MKNPRYILTIIWAFLFLINGNAQIEGDRFEILEERLMLYAKDHSKIDKRIDISITGTIQEFALSFSKETKLNLTIDPRINQSVVANFSDTRPRDILLHICKFNELDLTFSGSIISLIPYDAPPKPSKVKEIDVKFNSYNNRLELNLKNDTLDFVAKRISELSKKNVIATKAASMLSISGFIGSSDFEKALEQLAKRNDLSLTKEESDYYILDLNEQNLASDLSADNQKKGSRKKGRTPSKGSKRKVNNLSTKIAKVDSLGMQYLDIEASNVALADIITESSKKLNENFFLFVEPTETVTLTLNEVTFPELLDNLFTGTKYAYKNIDDIYLIGESASTGLKETTVIQLQHRSVKELVQHIPKDITDNLQVSEFIELNSLIVSGGQTSIDDLKDFVLEIDKSVPVVMIELLILDVQNNKELRAGFEAGLADQPVQAGGSVFPGIDFTFSANGINHLLGLLSGNGIVNLGRVQPNFYATLQAVEDNGYVNIRSKPRLSTLNGIEANLTLGETRYYLNERTTLQGAQNPISLQDRRYEPVNADFSIRIIPVVSGDGFVTLEIEVNQSDFIGQVQNDAPPPQVNRTFNSNIRIEEEEMIVLGGLETKGIEDSGTGVPFLARIPIIKWFFSKRRKANKKSKLLVFVKPTIIY